MTNKSLLEKIEKLDKRIAQLELELKPFSLTVHDPYYDTEDNGLPYSTITALDK